MKNKKNFKRFFISLIVILLLSLYVISCNNESNDKQINIQNDVTLLNHDTILHETTSSWQEKTFEEFYTKFFEDTSFQMSRIVFPLSGDDYPFTWTNEIDIDNISDTVLDYCYIKNHEFFWTRNEWGYFHPLEDTIYFEEVFRKNTDTLKEVEIRGKEVNGELSELKVFLDFKKKDGKWFLIYYGNFDI